MKMQCRRGSPIPFMRTEITECSSHKNRYCLGNPQAIFPEQEQYIYEGSYLDD